MALDITALVKAPSGPAAYRPPIELHPSDADTVCPSAVTPNVISNGEPLPPSAPTASRPAIASGSQRPKASDDWTGTHGPSAVGGTTRWYGGAAWTWYCLRA